MTKKIIYLLFSFSLLYFSCHESEKLTAIDKYFIEKLYEKLSYEYFEENSDSGYVKIGNFLSPFKKHAIVVAFDTIVILKIYELKNSQWVKLYQDKENYIGMVDGITAYIEDYNFDGIKDIGIKDLVSNGTSIMQFHLWLTEADSFRYIPEFQTIGNPVLNKQKKVIQGFTACCAFGEMTISDYVWEHGKLINTREFHITNYTYGIRLEGEMQYLNENREKKVKLTDDDILRILEKYSGKWHINDTIAIKDFTE